MKNKIGCLCIAPMGLSILYGIGYCMVRFLNWMAYGIFNSALWPQIIVIVVGGLFILGVILLCYVGQEDGFYRESLKGGRDETER